VHGQVGAGHARGVRRGEEQARRCDADGSAMRRIGIVAPTAAPPSWQ